MAMPKPSPKSSGASRSSTSNAVTATLTAKDRLRAWHRDSVAKHWRFALSGACVAIAAGAVGLNLGIVNLWERQTQSLYFELRGPVAPPKDIVILAIDEDSLSQGQYYSEDPERYKSLQPIESWPWKREAYANVVTKLMAAGAKAVAIDVTFPSPSYYGKADDDTLTEALKRYGNHVVLAAKYDTINLQQGNLLQASLPLVEFQDAGAHVGVINFLLEPDQQIHRLGQEFLRELAQNETDFSSTSATVSDSDDPPLLSFAEATLEAADKKYDSASKENIFFYGPDNTFEHIPFWKVLDDDPWQNELKSGRFFAGKTVIIGTTAKVHQDFHSAPFSESVLYQQPMAGVEILANTVATLENNLSPTQLVKSPLVNALIVLGLGLTVAGLMNRTKKPFGRVLVAGGGLGIWALVSYGAFVGSRIILISGTPMLAIFSMGLLDFGVSFGSDRLRRRQLRTSLARYATSPLVQEIISQQDDFQDLLDVNRADLIGMLLRDRYRIVKILGSGGFGETYLAQDTLRPGNPVCVVKQLKIVSDNPKAHQLARRLFEAEAAVLVQLGEHLQIPRLLAYFEVQESFYLVQEMIEGKLLRNLLSRSRLSQRAVVELLRDLLPVVSFVHSQSVIHRDIKPSNIIRRKSDGHYVLIDFGAVKTISTKLAGAATQVTSTVGIGTQGYMPSEQSAGMPSVRSDIYALGITAIEALTGRPPHAFKRGENGEIIWSHIIEDISPALSHIINQMVRYDFNNRYHSAQSVIDDLEQIDETELTDAPATISSSFRAVPATTLNQGTRPGVIDTNSALGDTQILPPDWPDELQAQPEDESDESSSES